MNSPTLPADDVFTANCPLYSRPHAMTYMSHNLTVRPLARHQEPKLLVEIIDEKAKWIGHHTFMRYPPKDWETEGYRTITWARYADAVNKLAYWLDEQLGKAQDDQTVAYLGPADPRYSLLLPALVKTARKFLVPDGRITDEGLDKLLEETKCAAWIYPEEEGEAPKTLDPNIELCALPSVEWCLDAEGWERYPYDKTWEKGKYDEIVIIHTSGTTGTPRPIYHTNGFYAAVPTRELSRKHWPRGVAYETWMGQAMLSSCPPQWLGGLSAFITCPVFDDTSCIMPPPDAVALPPAVFKKVVSMNVVHGLLSPPHTIVQLYNDPTTQRLLKSFDYIVFLGAALDQAIGDDLCEHVKLTSIIGSTETGRQLDLLPLDRMLWYTHDYVPENGHRMVRIPGPGAAADSSEDMYELVLSQPKDGENIYQGAFWNPAFKDYECIETKELYTPVKDADSRTRWVFSARKDDLTKLNWLAKFHAEDIEARIQQHPQVANVFVGGEGRPAPYVIVEAIEGVLETKIPGALLDELWSGVITQTNASDIKEIRIPKETVFVAKPEKPFKKSNKQTLMRKEIEKDYRDEIEEAYSRLAETKM